MIKSLVKDILDDVQTISYKDLEGRLERYDEVSFDIFDTLIKRNVPKPIDVFQLMEECLGYNDFCKNRVRAEIEARKLSGEVTLKDIYTVMTSYDDDIKDILMAAEIEYESNLCVVNKDMIDIYNSIVKNKRVFLISDMYLSKEVIESILEKNNITGYDELIISNEIGKNKSNGELFKYVIAKYKCKNICHIGNNFMADYISARKSGLKAYKIKTNTYRLPRKYTIDTNKGQYLESFLSNNHDAERDYFYNFGYERFGPVLYGFIKWMYEDFKKEGIQEVYFMARDGYIMQKVYRELGYNNDIPDKYFEASRRSLRVPSYCDDYNLENVIKESPLLSTTNMEQLLDSLGLEISDYKEKIEKYGFTLEEHIKRDELINNDQFIKFYEEIKQDVIDNSSTEKENLIKYLKQYDFNKKIAIVDIGWGGSMQKNLIQTLDNQGISNNITGYYLGLSKKSKQNLATNGYKAKGYLFDCLNNDTDKDVVIAFRPLFETLFLEQSGSVKCYETHEDGKTVAVRYEYEYVKDGELSHEAKKVRNIQSGAVDFARDFKNSKVSMYINSDEEILFKYMYETGTNPNMEDVRKFGDFIFFNNGCGNYLAKPQKIRKYVVNPKKCLSDLSESQWKLGFLKYIIKIPFPYLRLYLKLHRMSNNEED